MKLASLGLRSSFFVLYLLLILISTLVNIYEQHSHAEDMARAQAKTMFDLIVLTRTWNAQHGGVYVPVTATTQPNPYLKVQNRDVNTTDGIHMTKINPAYMTRQISELALKTEGVQVHITSLEPIRPKNTPTPWERIALERFEKGEREIGLFLYEEEKYRYMAPLFTERDCLKCHAEQGVEFGDIRGGISLTLPAKEILHNRWYARIITLVFHAIAFIMGCFFFMFYQDRQKTIALLQRHSNRDISINGTEKNQEKSKSSQ